MSVSLKLLMVEDNPNDAELAIRALKNEGFQLDSRLVDRKEDFIAALNDGPPEIILADFNVPGIDAAVSLDLARRMAPATPFIVVSGSIGEETTVELLKAGATDVVLKNRLDRLPWAVRRALKEARERESLRLAENALRQSEERYRRIVDSITDYIYTVRVRDGRPEEIVHGEACVAVTGHTPEEFASNAQLWIRLVHEEDRNMVEERVAQVLSGAAAEPLEHRIVRKDGEIRWVCNVMVPSFDERGQVASCDGLVQDVTERRRLEDQLRQSMKMEAIGRLTGGIAHDFNNQITAIMGFSELALEKIGADHPARADLAEVRSAGEKSAALIRQLLAFSRKQRLAMETVDLNGIVADSRNMLTRIIGEDIELIAKREEGLALVRLDPVQIHQVVMNLAVNARDAMPRGGKLIIETANVTVSEDEAVRREGAKPGPHVLLSVTDSGAGMDAATLERIFEPFYTTKETGKGTGLGLSTVYGIVKQLGGFIRVYSEVGVGTTFRIFLPALEGGDSRPAREESGEASWAGGDSGGSETILVVEDDRFVRDALFHCLTEQGYTALAASDGEEALRVFEERQGHIHLLIADMVMPKMDGLELEERALALQPNLKTLFISGFPEEMFRARWGGRTVHNFMRKPIVPQKLFERVRKALDELR